MVEYVILLLIFVIMILFYMNFNNFFKTVVFNFLCGFVVFAVVAYFLEQYISFSIFSVLTSMIVGIPGIVSLILFRIFCI